MNLKEAVVSILGVPEVPWTDEWPTRCLSPEHDDRSPSATVNVAKGVWYCHSCGRGGKVADLLGDVRLTDPSIAQMIEDSEKILRQFDAPPVRTYPESWLNLYDGRRPHPYWLSRGFSEATIAKWRLGYDFEVNRVTYPMRDSHGRILGLVKRTLTDEKPKYLYPKAVNKSHHLFGYHEARQRGFNGTLVVLEGAADVFALDQDGHVAVSTYGWVMSPQQERLIRNLHPREVIIAYDMDEAGEMGRQHVLYGTTLTEAFPVRCALWNPALGKDMDDLGEEGRRNVLAEADFLA